MNEGRGFTREEKARWNRNLLALIERVDGPGRAEKLKRFQATMRGRRATQTHANRSIGMWPVR